METTAEYLCAYCGESNTTFIDITGGFEQSYIEDCQVCCRPNQLRLQIDPDSLETQILTELEG